MAGKDLVLVVVPSHVMRRTVERCGHAIAPDTLVVTASKGIENQTHLTMSGVLTEIVPGLSADRLAVLSGPSFAREVARQMATVVTVASIDTKSADWSSRCL